MKRLAIYYGWPSCVNQHWGSLDDAVRVFSGFDIIIFGEGLEDPAHEDYKKDLDIISGVKEAGVEVNGYLDLGITTKNGRGLTDKEICVSLNRWKEFSVGGVLLDDLDPEYGTTIERIEKTAALVHSLGLDAIYNTDFYHCESPFYKRNSINKTDSVLIEPFGLGHSKEYDIPERLPANLQTLKDRGLRVLGISTYDSTFHKREEEQKQLFSQYKSLAEGIGLDGWGFTEMNYSALDAVLINFFEAVHD